MTIDPNDTLSALRVSLTGADAPDMYGSNGGRAIEKTRALLAHLDAGGQLPDAWTPFYAPAAALAAALQTIEQAAAGHDQADAHAAVETLTTSATIEQYDISRESDDGWSHLPAVACAIADRIRDNLEQALEQHDAEQTELLRSTAATLAQRGRDLDKQDAAARDRISRLIADVSTEEARANHAEQQRDDYRAEILRATQDRDIARAEAASARHELNNDTIQRIAAAGSRAPSPNAAYAAVARVAANLAETNTMTGADTGTYADLRQAMSDTIGHATMFRTNEEATRVTLAAFLAVGAARFGSRRKDDDLAQRTADYLNELASQLDNKPPRTIER